MSKRDRLVKEFFVARNKHFNLVGATPSTWNGKGEDNERDLAITHFVYQTDEFAYTCYPYKSDDDIKICLKGVMFDYDDDTSQLPSKYKVPSYFDWFDARLFGRLVTIKELDLNQVQYVVVDEYVPDSWKNVPASEQVDLFRAYNNSLYFYSMNPKELIGAYAIQCLTATNLHDFEIYVYDMNTLDIYEEGFWSLGTVAYSGVWKVSEFNKIPAYTTICDCGSYVKVIVVDEKPAITKKDIKELRQKLIDSYKENYTQEAIDRNKAMNLEFYDETCDGLIATMDFLDTSDESAYIKQKFAYRYDEEHDWLILCNVYSDYHALTVPPVFDVCKVFFENFEYVDLCNVRYLMEGSKKLKDMRMKLCNLVGEKLQLGILLDETGKLCCAGKKGLSLVRSYFDNDFLADSVYSHYLPELKAHMSLRNEDTIGFIYEIEEGDLGYKEFKEVYNAHNAFGCVGHESNMISLNAADLTCEY